ncbi:MAG: AAA family ATPase [Armatimonadota bacterium]
MPDTSTPAVSTGLTSSEQRHMLLEAKAWWQEGDRALDYLAERARIQSRVEQIQLLLTALEKESVWSAPQIEPLLPLVRRLSANRAINRTLATDEFAQALRRLLFGGDSLPLRLKEFLETQRVGEQTASQFLYAASPHRYPLVSPATRAVLAPTASQRPVLLETARGLYGDALTEASAEVRGLILDFTRYEAARGILGVEDFVDVNAILWHAREMPGDRAQPGRREATFAVASNSAPASPANRVQEGVAWYGTEPFGASDEAAIRTTEPDVMAYIEGFIASQGFTFPPLAVRDYYIALKTKPFVILSGISGTGKTRLTELMAEALTSNVTGQYLLLPVRPDWTDSTSLLGYQNVLTDQYVSTPFLDKLVIASHPENRERAFFLCLDEMNLARVEHYFADILSAMETRSRTIPLQGSVGRSVTLPNNVFLTGSVNVDEATHPFSKKVLDRANTIEFTDVSLRTPAPTAPRSLPDIPARERQRIFLTARVTDVRAAEDRLRILDSTFPECVTETLAALNEKLQVRGLQFGYRVRDEAMRYIANSFAVDAGGAGLLVPEDRISNFMAALDLQILQKALPRISGTQETLEKLLAELETWAVSEGLPRSAAKIARMRRRAIEDGFVTFYEG